MDRFKEHEGGFTTFAGREELGAFRDDELPAGALSGPGQHEILPLGAVGVIHVGWHGYPEPRVRWHHHEEIEFHLIREGPGSMMVGDAMVPFGVGQVTMIGGDVPHTWISDLSGGRSFPRRDIYCHVHPDVLRRVAAISPDLGGVESLLDRSMRVISLTGHSARRAGGLIEDVCAHKGSRRFADLMELVAAFEQAPQEERDLLLPAPYCLEEAENRGERRLNEALAMITTHLTERDFSLEQVAAHVGMEPSSFSRFFSQMCGMGFADFVRTMRISMACSRLVGGDEPVTVVARECGYANMSNFNRRFHQETGMTPSQYRRRSTSPKA